MKGHRPRGRRRRWLVGAGLALACVLGLAACRTPPATLPPLPTPPTVPVVLVPGVTGVSLVDAETGELAWGDGRRLLRPRDHGWQFALPLVPGDHPELVPAEVIREIRLGPITKPVYGPVLDALVAAGYRLGDLEAPDSDATLYPFAYDWRRSNVDSAAVLAERLEAVRRARGVDELEVDLICQSNGGYVCRWLAKVGVASLEEAEAGPRQPAGIRVRRIVLAGTANGGSWRIFREMTRGRRYLPFGRHIRPETLFTLPSFFQDLPAFDRDRIVDHRGRDLGLTLDEPDDWVARGWGPFAEDARERIASTAIGPGIFGAPDRWREHLEAQLDESRRFHEVLRRDAPGFGLGRLCSIQSGSEGTPTGAVLVEGDSGGSELLFSGDGELRFLLAARARVEADGDLHASLPSQGALSPGEKAVLRETRVEGEHFELILEREALEAMVDCLAR